MAVNQSFSLETINVTAETFEYCLFDRCVLICNSPQGYLQFRYNRLIGCTLIGDGWPGAIKDVVKNLEKERPVS